MSLRREEAGSSGERRRPSTEIEARLPRSSASLLEDSLNHAEEWVAAIKRYFLRVACQRRSARMERKEAAASQVPVLGLGGMSGGGAEGRGVGWAGQATGEAARMSDEHHGGREGRAAGHLECRGGGGGGGGSWSSGTADGHR